MLGFFFVAADMATSPEELSWIKVLLKDSFVMMYWLLSRHTVSYERGAPYGAGKLSFE
jgi:hypothetical protein